MHTRAGHEGLRQDPKTPRAMERISGCLPTEDQNRSFTASPSNWMLVSPLLCLTYSPPYHSILLGVIGVPWPEAAAVQRQEDQACKASQRLLVTARTHSIPARPRIRRPLGIPEAARVEAPSRGRMDRRVATQAAGTVHQPGQEEDCRGEGKGIRLPTNPEQTGAWNRPQCPETECDCRYGICFGGRGPWQQGLDRGG